MPQFENNSSPGNPISLLNVANDEAECQIGELKETIAKLAAEGHEVKDATKHLNTMIEMFRIMKSRP